MGLDMYLRKHIFIGAKWDHLQIEGEIKLSTKGKNIPINFKKVSYIVESVAYWRKANAIHEWFVQHLGEGVDDCKPIYCELDNLKELVKVCERILSAPEADRERIAKTLLPTKDGFFFGSTKYDEYYYDDLKATVEMLNEVIADHDDTASVHYEYIASW